MKITKETSLQEILTNVFGEGYNKEPGNYSYEVNGISFRLMHRETHSLIRVGSISGVQLTGYNPSYRGHSPMLRVLVKEGEIDIIEIKQKYLDLQLKRQNSLNNQEARRKTEEIYTNNLTALCQEYGLPIGAISKNYNGFNLTLHGLSNEQLEAIGKAFNIGKK